MSLWTEFRNRLRYFSGRSRFDLDLDEEVRFHLETRAAELAALGVAPAEARAQARREFGSTARMRERTRAAWQFRFVEEALADLRYARRTILRSPGFAFAAVLSLALGIGANSTVFSVTKAVLRGELAVREPDRLVSFHEGGGVARLSYPDYLDYREQVNAFEGVAAAYPIVPASFGSRRGPERVWGQLVTTNYFSVVGAEPALGRGLLAGEEHSRVVVISDGLWKRNFGGDPAIVGRNVVVCGAEYTVAGVAPPGFQGALRGLVTDFWIPLGLYPEVVPMLRAQGVPEQMRDYPWLVVEARLKPGINRREAQSALQVVAKRLDQAYPRPRRHREPLLVPAGTFPVGLGQIRPLLGILTVVVGLVLLVACANTANLLLARAAARQTEIGIRLAIGAGRGRLIRQLLVESLLLSLVGAIFGLGLAFAGTRALGSLQSSFPIPAAMGIKVDTGVVLFTAALSVVTAVLFGLVPAVKGTATDVTSMLRRDASAFSAARALGLKNGLVAVQVALSMVLLVGAGLFLRSLQNASSVPLGMRAGNILLAGFDPRAAGYSNLRAAAFFQSARERVAALPGVESAGLVDILPLSLAPHAAGVARPGRNTTLAADIYGVSPGYFESLGIELLRGRDFDPGAVRGPAPAVINEALATRLFGKEDPVGRTVAWEGMPHQVIGVAAVAKSRTLAERGQPQIYVSLEREYDKFWGLLGVVLAVRTHGRPGDMAAAVRQQIRELDPNMAVFNVQTMEEHVGRAMLLPRLCASLFGIFGAIGMALAAVGLYGLMSYSVRRRTKEIGIRMALGAGPAAVIAMVARQGLGPVALGGVAGLLLAAAVSRALGGFLFGVGARDSATFLAVSALLFLVALAAILIPARRAAAMDGLESIRYE